MRIILFAIATTLFGSNAFLSVDFQQNGDTVQSGFTQFSGTTSQSLLTQSFATIFGNVDITINSPVDANNIGGGFFNRGGMTNSGAFTYSNLYNSFAFNNSSCNFCANATSQLLITISGAGIAPSTAYRLTFYSFDTDHGRAVSTGTHTVTVFGVSGTSGTSTPFTWTDSAPPTANGQYSVTQAFVSDATGSLHFLMNDSYVNNFDSRSGVRLNALEISNVPEPATLLLFAAGLAGIVWRRRA